MQNRLERLFEKIPKLNLSISGTRVVVTWLVVYCVCDLVGKFL